MHFSLVRVLCWAQPALPKHACLGSDPGSQGFLLPVVQEPPAFFISYESEQG